jgi:hypothetical protein
LILPAGRSERAWAEFLFPSVVGRCSEAPTPAPTHGEQADEGRDGFGHRSNVLLRRDIGGEAAQGL